MCHTMLGPCKVPNRQEPPHCSPVQHWQCASLQRTRVVFGPMQRTRSVCSGQASRQFAALNGAEGNLRRSHLCLQMSRLSSVLHSIPFGSALLYTVRCTAAPQLHSALWRKLQSVKLEWRNLAMLARAGPPPTFHSNRLVGQDLRAVLYAQLIATQHLLRQVNDSLKLKESDCQGHSSAFCQRVLSMRNTTLFHLEKWQCITIGPSSEIARSLTSRGLS